jgi:hypothetical protein
MPTTLLPCQCSRGSQNPKELVASFLGYRKDPNLLSSQAGDKEYVACLDLTAICPAIVGLFPLLLTRQRLVVKLAHGITTIWLKWFRFSTTLKMDYASRGCFSLTNSTTSLNGNR